MAVILLFAVNKRTSWKVHTKKVTKKKVDVWVQLSLQYLYLESQHYDLSSLTLIFECVSIRMKTSFTTIILFKIKISKQFTICFYDLNQDSHSFNMCIYAYVHIYIHVCTKCITYVIHTYDVCIYNHYCYVLSFKSVFYPTFSYNLYIWKRFIVADGAKYWFKESNQ